MAVRNHVDYDAPFVFAIDDPIRLEQDLPVFANPKVAQFPWIAAPVGKARQILHVAQQPLQYMLGAQRAIDLGDVCDDGFQVALGTERKENFAIHSDGGYREAASPRRSRDPTSRAGRTLRSVTS